MGSSTGSLLVPDDEALEAVLRSGCRRVAIHAEDEARLRERMHLAKESGDVATHPVWRDEETALRATKRVLKLARKTGRRVHVLHVTTAEEMALLAGGQGHRHGRGHAPASDPGGARLLSRAGHAGPDEPADPR